MAKIIELIETEDRRGTGTDKDPMRLVSQLWTKDGQLVAEYDVCGDNWYRYNGRAKIEDGKSV